MIGSRIDRYLLKEKLGEGGMGLVWRAEDTRLARDVALKVLAAHLTRTEEGRARFMREARAASKLEHPGIARVNGFGETDGQVWIDYQLIEGENLSQRLQAGPLPLPQLLEMACGAASALAHAHSRGVLHRDITAGNIMIRPDGSPVIVDFGLARMSTDATLTTTGTTIGTSAYMPPEQWQNKPGTPQSDLWSLGVVLYRAATGEPPFKGDTREAVMYQVLNAEPEKPQRLRKELPDEFCRVVMRLLEKDPRDRIAGADRLAAILCAQRSAQAEASAAPEGRESVTAGLRRFWHRMLRLTLKPAEVAILFAVAALIVVGVWMVRQRAESQRERVLAVMPLRNTSRDSVETAYLGEGLGQELARRLGDAGGFRMLPWSTTAAFADQQRTPQSLARKLRADDLLMGSFSCEGERLQVLVELVDGHTGLQLWSERYVRVTGDLIALQTEMATAVAERVARSPDVERTKRIASSAPGNAEAYDLYIRGATYLNSPDESQKPLAEPMFQRAVELDPNLAVAWVGLGAVRVDRHYFARGGTSGDLATADSCFRRALDIDPALPEAVRGLISLGSETGETDRGLELAAKALQNQQSPLDAFSTAGWAFLLGGLPELALQALDRAIELNPNDPGSCYYRALALCWTGNDQRCLEAGKAYIREFGEDGDVYSAMGTAATGLGDLKDAELFLERSVQVAQAPLYAPPALAAHFMATHQPKRLQAMLDTAIAGFQADLESHPGNFRLRSDLVCLLALSRQAERRDQEFAIVALGLRNGNAATGGDETAIPFATAAAGDLQSAIGMLSDLPINDRSWAGWWPGTQLTKRGVSYRGGQMPSLLRSPEWLSHDDQLNRIHSERLSKYRPILEAALRR